MLDGSGDTITNGLSIDKLYAFNRFYLGLSKLVKESTAARPLLVSAALVESASETFQRTALLLYDQLDVLCELVIAMNLEEQVCLQSVQDVAVFLGTDSPESKQSKALREIIIEP